MLCDEKRCGVTGLATAAAKAAVWMGIVVVMCWSAVR